MKALKYLDLALQLLFIMAPLVCGSVFHHWEALIFTYYGLGGLQLLSVLFWGIQCSREQKSYGRRVFEKLLILLTGAVLLGIILLWLGVPFLVWMLYFMVYGTVMIELWYVGITLMEVLSGQGRPRAEEE